MMASGHFNETEECSSPNQSFLSDTFSDRSMINNHDDHIDKPGIKNIPGHIPGILRQFDDFTDDDADFIGSKEVIKNIASRNTKISPEAGEDEEIEYDNIVMIKPLLEEDKEYDNIIRDKPQSNQSPPRFRSGVVHIIDTVTPEREERGRRGIDESETRQETEGNDENEEKFLSYPSGMGVKGGKGGKLGKDEVMRYQTSPMRLRAGMSPGRVRGNVSPGRVPVRIISHTSNVGNTGGREKDKEDSSNRDNNNRADNNRDDRNNRDNRDDRGNRDSRDDTESRDMMKWKIEAERLRQENETLKQQALKAARAEVAAAAATSAAAAATAQRDKKTDPAKQNKTAAKQQSASFQNAPPPSMPPSVSSSVPSIPSLPSSTPFPSLAGAPSSVPFPAPTASSSTLDMSSSHSSVPYVSSVPPARAKSEPRGDLHSNKNNKNGYNKNGNSNSNSSSSNDLYHSQNIQNIQNTQNSNKSYNDLYRQNTYDGQDNYVDESRDHSDTRGNRVRDNGDGDNSEYNNERKVKSVAQVQKGPLLPSTKLKLQLQLLNGENGGNGGVGGNDRSEEDVVDIQRILWEGGFLWKIPFNGKGLPERRIVSVKRASCPSIYSKAVRIAGAGLGATSDDVLHSGGPGGMGLGGGTLSRILHSIRFHSILADSCRLYRMRTFSFYSTLHYCITEDILLPLFVIS